MGLNDAPRVLRVTYEFYIPPGAPGKVHTSRRRAAVAAMTDAVKAIARDQLPLAASVRVRQEWMYRWDDKPQDFSLHWQPPENTAGTADPADESTD